MEPIGSSSTAESSPGPRTRGRVAAPSPSAPSPCSSSFSAAAARDRRRRSAAAAANTTAASRPISATPSAESRTTEAGFTPPAPVGEAGVAKPPCEELANPLGSSMMVPNGVGEAARPPGAAAAAGVVPAVEGWPGPGVNPGVGTVVGVGAGAGRDTMTGVRSVSWIAGPSLGSASKTTCQVPTGSLEDPVHVPLRAEPAASASGRVAPATRATTAVAVTPAVPLNSTENANVVAVVPDVGATRAFISLAPGAAAAGTGARTRRVPIATAASDGTTERPPGRRRAFEGTIRAACRKSPATVNARGVPCPRSCKNRRS